MGSATPSVEAWQMMKTGVIARHTLSKRLAGGKMPQIKAINLSNEPPDTLCISRELEKEINSTLAEKTDDSFKPPRIYPFLQMPFLRV